MQNKSGYNNAWLYLLTAARLVYPTMSIKKLGSEIIC